MTFLKNTNVVSSVPKCLIDVYNEVVRNLKHTGDSYSVKYPSVEGYEFLIKNGILKVSYANGVDRFAIISSIGDVLVSDDVLLCV